MEDTFGHLAAFMSSVRKAFLLGAGLGTRLRPLTESLPKPLVPVGNRPLLTYAMDHLINGAGVGEFLVNTHHCPEAYSQVFPEGEYRECPIGFRHEPVLLDTGGGIDNVRDWLPDSEPFFVYNGDILTDLDLSGAWEHHLGSGALATLLLRSEGDELRVGFDRESGQIVDLRGALRPDWDQRFQFTGIYLLSPEFLSFLEPGKIESVVLAFLRAIEANERIGGFLVDGGTWSDLGERESYLAANSRVASYGENLTSRLASSARISDEASIDASSVIGEGVSIGKGAAVENSVLWDHAIVEPGARLSGVVVRSGRHASGILENVDI